MTRPAPLLVTAVVLQVTAIVLYAVNHGHQRFSPAWGWLPGIVILGMTALACRRAAATPGLSPVSARLWRSVGWVSLLVGLGTIGDARQSMVDPDRVTQQQHDPVTTVFYVLAVGILLWSLLRLPITRHGRTARFLLDALVVAITVSVFAWYFTTRAIESGEGTRTTLPMLMLAVLGLIVALALVKIAMSGLGGLERGTIRWFAVAAAVGTAGGGIFPILFEVPPGMSGSQIFTPATMIFVAIAADRQRRVGAATSPRRPRRPFSLVPYAAVAATDGLLIIVSRDTGRTVLVVAVAATLLTALVAVRQIAALRENHRLLHELDHRATHDALTGLANRALFEQATAAALSGRVSLALIDLDDFKAINDRLGHTVGDALLVEVARRLGTEVRSADLVARLGGDEFALVLPGLAAEEAVGLLERVRTALARPVHALGYDLLVRASIGLAECRDGDDAEELLRRADVAMYQAKEDGKGRYAVYDAVLERDQAADAQLGADLRHALDAGEFRLVFQPIVRLPGGAWTGLETLVRWGRVTPDVFVPIAERTGLIVPLGSWILRDALRRFAGWITEFGDGAPAELGVNVSARQLREPGFAAEVGAVLSEYGVPPHRLVVEVTETAVFDGGVALDTLVALSATGVKVALDDFGTGHSSLGLLRTVPADTLKVDKSFVSSEDAVIAAAMIQITDGLHLKAVAEGVETEAQAVTLHGLGYRFAQGFHFARPLPPDEIHARLSLARSSS